jgi:hypothetical protein
LDEIEMITSDECRSKVHLHRNAYIERPTFNCSLSAVTRVKKEGFSPSKNTGASG